jgi:hypothetical protein
MNRLTGSPIEVLMAFLKLGVTSFGGRPGQPMTAHWEGPDPAAVEGTETQKWVAFRNAFHSAR